MAASADLLAGAMIVNALVQVALVAAALARGLRDDKPAMRLAERLTLLGLFLTTYAAGVAFAGWATATTVLIAAYATVLSGLGILAGCWIAASLARLIWQTGTLGLTRLLGAAMLLGGLAWMAHLGAPQPDGIDGLLRVFALQAMAALTIASGGMMMAAIRLP